MPKTILTTGQRGLDREVDLLWQRIAGLQAAIDRLQPQQSQIGGAVVEPRPSTLEVLPLEMKTEDGSVDLFPLGVAVDPVFLSLVQDAAGYGEIAGVDPRGLFFLVVDDAGGVLPTGVQARYMPIKGMNGTITSVTLLADQSGSVTLDIWKCTYAQFDAGSTHPVSADSIVGSGTPPAIAIATKYRDTVLSGWTTTTFKDGDVFAFDVKIGATAIKKVWVLLGITRTD